jgi:hypothetical protein
MSIATIKASNRYYNVVPATGGVPGAPFLEIGPAGTAQQVSTLVIQFKPSLGFNGSFAVVARAMGPAANEHDAPFIPVPYRRINVANVASDYALVSDPITTTALIQVPSNGLCVALECAAPTQGQCEVMSWDLQGSSAV